MLKLVFYDICLSAGRKSVYSEMSIASSSCAFIGY